MSLAQLQAVEETFHADEAQRTEVADKVDEVAESAKQAWGDALAKSFAEQGAAAKSLRSGQLLLVRVAVPGGGTPPSWAEMSWDGGSTASAQLVTALPRVDPKFQQRVALYSIPARGGPAPGATVSVQLPSGAEREGALVPTSALVWWDGAAWVYVQVETGKFSRQRIAGPDNQADGQIFVAGLSGETPVVIEGAQILLSEESRDKIQVGEEGRSK